MEEHHLDIYLLQLEVLSCYDAQQHPDGSMPNDGRENLTEVNAFLLGTSLDH